MNFELVAPRKLSADRVPRGTATEEHTVSAMKTAVLIDSLITCCFEKDCAAKGLEAAILEETIFRLKYPFSWRLRRWWNGSRKVL
jgi:hypothetical protein